MEGGEAGVVAVTKVFAIRVRLDDRVRYITDGEKTSLASSITYISNPEKTEQFFFTSVLNCSSVDTALSEMMETKQQFGKMGGVLGYHFIQSFQPGEVTPEQAHAIGLEFAKRLFGKRYEVVISTHLNKHHLHNHLVVNSVSCVDGQKYHSSPESYYNDVRGTSDALCRENDLSVITPQGNPTMMTAYLEFNGQIVTFEVQNTSVSTGVSIKKTGPVQAVSNQPIRYVFSNIKNTSTVALDSFYWRDQLPAQVTLNKIVTGSYNQPLSYKVVYKTNLSGDYRTLADNLSTSKVYVLDARPAVLGLAANERVTEVMFVFGNVKAGFAQVETPYIYATARSGLANNSGIVNVADVGGLYNGQWIQAVSRWLTTVYTKTTVKLPKTGY